MTVAATNVEIEFTNVVVNVPFVVGIQTSGIRSEVYVKYGELKQLAVQDVDYALTFPPDLLSYTITPLAPLLAKIAVSGPNVVYAGRALPYTTDFDLDDAFVREKLVNEVDRLWMGNQQSRFELGDIQEQFGTIQDAAVSAAEAAASAAAADADAIAANADAATALSAAGNAATSASNANASAISASNSQNAAATSRSNAATSETNAAGSATAAAGSAASAASNATSTFDNASIASSAAGTATTGASTATTKAAEASASAAAAATSAINAGTRPAWKNRVINGDFAIDQRNSGALVTVLSATSAYAMDRWYLYPAQAPGALSGQRIADTTDLGEYYLRVKTTGIDVSLAAGDIYIFGQKMEGNFCRDFGWGNAQAKPITISFWVKGNTAMTLPIQIGNAASTRTWLGSFVVTTGWTKVVLNVPGDTTGAWEIGNLVGVNIVFGLAAGTTWQGVAGWQAGNFATLAGMTNFMNALDTTLDIKDFQVELGSEATPFERVPYDDQLARCQRYFQNYVGNSAILVGSYATAATAVNIGFTHLTTMRAIPTVVKAGTWATANCGQPAFSPYGVNAFVATVTGTATGAVAAYCDSADDSLSFSAEL